MKQTGATALFRLSVLGPIVSREILGRGELTKIIEGLAQHEYVIPGSRRRYIGEKTIESWYYAWRHNGIGGLEPKTRDDLGQSKLSPEAQVAIFRDKRDNPKLSVAKIIELIHANEQFTPEIISRSTVHRLLQAHSLSHQPSSIEKQIDKHLEVFDEFFKKPSKFNSSREDMLESFRWMLNLLQCRYSAVDLQRELGGIISNAEMESLLRHIHDGSLMRRNRAVTVLARNKKIPYVEIADFLSIGPKQVGYTMKLFNFSRLVGLFGPRKERPKKYDDINCKDAVFALLHSPPKEHDVNRTSWTLNTLSETLRKGGTPIGEGTISKIVKVAGFKFRKAKKVLTSTDPEYKEKLHEITNILANLKPNEKFFSVDEYGPFSIKMQGGVSLTRADQLKVIPQYQKSKGSLIVTAALELCENQITHFYSKRKNTQERLRLIEMLIAKYSNQSCLYFSWDAASWHASKLLNSRLDEINSSEYRTANRTPSVVLAPLPSCAQFLNVIESVFSGMAKAIIHNSNYQSVEECRSAIDRYFSERNAHFKSCPARAGNNIWGKERVRCEFSESSNCKDPLYR